MLLAKVNDPTIRDWL